MVGSEELIIALDGKVIQTYSSAPYLNNPLSIDLPVALEAAHPNATANLSSAVLTMTRTGTACAGFWGTTPSPLLSLRLSFKEEKIAFSNGGDIYVMNADGTGVTQLTSGTASDVESAWSPDRTKIAFSRQVVGGYYDIYVMNADGSGVTQLTISAGTSLGDRNPAWSADGLKIAFDRYEADFDKNIYTMNADGTGITALTTATTGESFAPTWSPDGSKIAYTRYENGPEQIYQTNSDGSGTIQLSSCVSSCSQPAWSPDGTKIEVGTQSGYIHIMGADGSNLQQVPNASGVRPAWSPDGGKIAFQNGGIRTINIDGTALTPLTTSGVEASW